MMIAVILKSKQIDEFAYAILNKSEVLHGTLTDAYETMALVYKIYEADLDWSMRWGIKQLPLEILPLEYTD